MDGPKLWIIINIISRSSEIQYLVMSDNISIVSAFVQPENCCLLPLVLLPGNATLFPQYVLLYEVPARLKQGIQIFERKKKQP